MDRRSKKPRLFVAIELDASVKNALAELQERYRKAGFIGRYENPDNLHITLAFIGETDRLADIANAVSAIRFEPFEIETTAIGRFITRYGCDLLWMGLSNEDKLGSLAGSVRRALDSIGVRYSPTPFKPHITLMKDTAGWPALEMTPRKMLVSKISLMETVMIGGKPKYVSRT